MYTLLRAHPLYAYTLVGWFVKDVHPQICRVPDFFLLGAGVIQQIVAHNPLQVRAMLGGARPLPAAALRRMMASGMLSNLLLYGRHRCGQWHAL